MADTTPIYSWPYQEAADPPDGASLGQDLAEAIETTVDGIDGRVGALEADTLDARLDVLEAATTNKPAGRIRQGTAQTGITDNTQTAISFDVHEFDTHSYHSTSVNNTRVTPTKAGKYRVSGVICLASTSDYVFTEAVIRKNGSSYLVGPTRYAAPVNSTVSMPVTAVVEVNGSTDYFEVVMLADRSGNATTNTTVSSFRASTLEWEYLRP